MRVLISGGTGFIGINMVPAILKECHDIEVLLLCRDSNKASKLFEHGCIKFTEQLNDVTAFNPDVVFHLAAMSTSRNDADVIEPLINSNILFGVKLLETLSKCNNLKLFINTGSFAEYRLGPAKVDNAYLYSATKTAFRAFLDYFASLCRFKYITVIPYTVYGGTPTVKRIMDYMMDAIDASQPVDMTKGEQVLDFIHVDDIASFYVHILNNWDSYLSLEQGEEFHLGTGIGTSIRKIADIIEDQSCRVLNINWGGLPYRERDTMYSVAPIAKNIELTGWKSTISIENGVKMFLKNHGKRQ